MGIRYMAAEDVVAIREASDYHELAEVALRIIGRMPPWEDVGMVCGPISTGGFEDRDVNLWYFNAAIETLIAEGYLLFNQMPFEDKLGELHQADETGYDQDILDVFYAAIFNTGRITIQYFMHNWESSRGARWEREQALSRDVEIVDLDEEHLPVEE